jgi:hypothetical protein
LTEAVHSRAGDYVIHGDALDMISRETGTFSLIATDPPYAFAGSGAIVNAALSGGMDAIGYEKKPREVATCP